MPSRSSGRIEKVRKRKFSTPHQKNHRWESFSTKISKFNSLQPLRKVRRHDLENEDLSTATSYFQTGLQKWGELNISKGFTSFKRDVYALCESLPQILHFQDKIMGSLAEYISLQDKDSLEPLLDLLTAFAHDLGARFEKHYLQSINLLLAIAGKPQDVDVIEWTFGALAFLFKYLSKLLVPDLRPTYDIMAPLLGRTRHPQHIARFAAEAMSFLVKKAAAPSHRETALKNFVEHVRNDLISTSGDRQFTLYNDGLMTMFAEAIKGTDMTIHSTGGAIVCALIDAIPESERDLSRETIWTNVVCGVLTSVIHHGTADTMGDFLDEVLAKIKSDREALTDDDKLNMWQTVPYVRVIGVLAGVRRGSRIRKWDALVREFVEVLRKTGYGVDELPQDQGDILWNSVVVQIAILWHHAPMDTLIPHISTLTKILTKEPYMRWFISFCAYFCDLDASRFGSLFRSEFQRFIAMHWSQDENEGVLCLLLPRMIENKAFPALGEKDCCRLPQPWQDQIVSKFERLEISPFPERGPYNNNKDPQEWRDRCLPKYAGLLQLLELTSIHPSTNAGIAKILSQKLKLALRPSSSLPTDEDNFIASQGFRAYLRMSKVTGLVDTALSPLLRAAVPRFARSVGFLDAYLAYERIQRESQKTDDAPSTLHSDENSTMEEDPAIKSLVENLSSPSHDLRLVSLELLKQMSGSEPVTECVGTMLQIEQTPLTHEHTRAIAMHLRSIGQHYNTIDSSSWLKDGIPRFMFGMLTVKLSPVWDDTAESLKYLAQSKMGEEAVSAMAFRWLQNPSMRWTPSASESTGGGRRIYTDFECTAVTRLEGLANTILESTEKVYDALLSSFDAKQQLAEYIPATARSRALKVLHAIPAVAEKRSRQLVPHFLCWAAEDGDDEDSSNADEAFHDYASTWSLADRKAMLGIFAQFINSKVLYKHTQVYDALLTLMENGDGEMQRLALKAILSWKQDGVTTYRENLEYLLDEARFKNELAVFLQGDNMIKPEHRAELMPVLLRLLYGRTIAKKGVASGRNGLQATRLAVLRNLSVQDMAGFLEIAAKKLKDIRVVGTKAHQKKLFSEPVIATRKQIGFLNMISSLISELGTNVEPYMDVLVNSVLYCLVYASRQLSGSASSDEEEKEEEDVEKISDLSLLKTIRTVGIKCLMALFQNAQNFQWEAYQTLIIEDVVAPRLANLSVETTQGVSAMLHLFATWSVLPKAALFLAPIDDVFPQGVLPAIISCISKEKTKDEVKIFVLNILQNLVKLALAPAQESEFNEIIKSELLEANATETLSTITTVLHSSNLSNDLLESCVETVLSLAPVLRDLDSSQSVIRMSSFLLQQPPRRVSPKTKGRILLIVEGFVGLPDAANDQVLLEQVYKTLSSLFSYFKDRENRHALSRALLAISKQDAALEEIASLCSELNSFKEGRIDEPDFDRRLAAFNAISMSREVPFTPKQWLPIIHNLIFSIRLDEEFGVLSSNSADGMRRLVQNVADCKSDTMKTAFYDLMRTILLPSIYSGAKEESATVRREYLRVMGFLITTMPDWEPVADLSGLLTERNEDTSEPSFFFNILSPASSRQLEAMRTLETANAATQMSSQNLGQFFIPLLEHFIYNRVDGNDDQGLGAHATSTIGTLALSLSWNHYRTTLYRYISYVESRSEMQKHTIRLLGKFVDALVLSSNANESDDKSGDEMDIDAGDASPPGSLRLQQTVPKMAKLSVDVLDYILPPLVKHLHEKDESEVSYRVPVGVVVVKLLKLLPAEQIDQKLAGVLTDICHILRSKAWEAREMARDTLVKIAVVLGSSYFGFLLKELRGALTRGYQLHVLSYTMHSILVATVPTFAAGDLDHCLPSVVTVIMDDIFGTIGQEKDAEGYTTQMKEIKSSKSQDSMELVAKNASISHLIHLVRPLQALLQQKVDLKMVRKIDALMARISGGLLQNAAAASRDTLVFCYEIIQETYRSQKPEVVQKMDPRVRKYLVQRGAKKSGERGRTAKHTHKMVRFSFDTLRSMFKKHDDLRTPANVAGFLPLIGDAIVDSEDEVKISAFRLLATLVKVPFDSEDGNNLYKVAVREATKSVSQSTASTTDLSQAAIKLLSVVLRERKDVVVKDAAVDMLLGKLKEDFTEPLYRHVTFNFLRSVMDRRVETAVVYDTLDHVGTVMITNDDKDTRDLARGAFFQFIREYPQKKARWSKQLNFVVANLKYEREGGRVSVMEVIHLLLMKSSPEFVQEIIGTCFLPLFFVLANDDSEKCRTFASGLLREVFQKADKQRTQQFLVLLRSWLDKDDNPVVMRLGLETFGYYFESNEEASNNKKDGRLLLKKVADTLKADSISDTDGQLLETALRVLQLMSVKLHDEALSGNKKDLWADAARYLRHSQPLVKLAAVRLINAYLADFAKKRTKAFAGEAIEGSHGLTLDLDVMYNFTRLALGSLNSNEIDETLAAELVQVIVFLGTCLPVSAGADGDEEAEGEDEEKDEKDTEEEVEVQDEDAAAATKGNRQGVDYLFWRLSHILRREIPPRSLAINSKVAAMEILETVCRRVLNTSSRPSLKTILVPLQQLTDRSIPDPFSNDEIFKTKLDGIKTRAQIMMDSLQKKFGTAEYSKVLVEIRDEVRARRLQRNSKRKIEAITQPEKYGRDKRKKFEKNKERRKVRSKEQKVARQSYKGW